MKGAAPPAKVVIERGSRHHVVSETAVTLVGRRDWGVGFVGLCQTFVGLRQTDGCGELQSTGADRLGEVWPALGELGGAAVGATR
jgi:hypothetical protein